MLHRAPILARQVLTELESRIYDGAIKPGHKVNESHLAAELDVSRGPIREACRLLESERVLVTYPQRGSFVRLVSEEEAASLFDIRQELSGMISRLLAKRASRNAADRLIKHVDEMDDCIAAQDTACFFPANLAFHEALLVATDNERLKDIFLGIFKELRLFRIRSVLMERDQPELIHDYNRASNDGHRRIAVAVASRSAERLEGELRHQVEASRKRSFAAFERAQIAAGGRKAQAGS